MTKDRLKARLRPVLEDGLNCHRGYCFTAAYALDDNLFKGGSCDRAVEMSTQASVAARELIAAVFRVIDQVVDDD